MKKIIILPLLSVLLVFVSIVFAILAFIRWEALYSFLTFGFCLASLVLATIYAVIGRKSARKMAIGLTLTVSVLVSFFTSSIALFNLVGISVRDNRDVRTMEKYGTPALMVQNTSGDGIIMFGEPREEGEAVYDNAGLVRQSLGAMSWKEVTSPKGASDSEDHFVFYVKIDYYEGQINVYSSGNVDLSLYNKNSTGKFNSSFFKSGETTVEEAKEVIAIARKVSDDYFKSFEAIAIARKVSDDYFKSFEADKEKAMVEGDLDHFLTAMEAKDLKWVKYQGSLKSDDGSVLAAIKNANHVLKEKSNNGAPFFVTLYYNFDEKQGHAGDWSYALHNDLEKVMLKYKYLDSSLRAHYMNFYYEITVEEGQAITSAADKLT